MISEKFYTVEEMREKKNKVRIIAYDDNLNGSCVETLNNVVYKSKMKNIIATLEVLGYKRKMYNV